MLQNTNNVWLSEYKNKVIDFIISNPPFIGEKEFNDENFLSTYPEVKLEPVSAIVTRGDADGLNPFLQIINNSNINKTKLHLFQCNSENIDSLITEIHKLGKYKIKVIKDKNNLDRFLIVKKSVNKLRYIFDIGSKTNVKK